MNKMIWIGIGVVVIAALVAGAYVMQNQPSTNEPSLSTGADTSADAVDASASSFIADSTPTPDQTLPGLG